LGELSTSQIAAQAGALRAGHGRQGRRLLGLDLADNNVYVSPRLLEIYGFAPGTTFAGRDELIAQIPFLQEDRPLAAGVQ
jgi:hypothetical protein